MPHQLPAGDQGLDPRGDQVPAGLEEPGRIIPQRRLAVGGVPLLLEGLQGENQAGVQPGRGVVREAQVDRDPVGGPKADAVDLPGHPVGFGLEDRLGLGAVAVDELDALAGRHPVGLQENVELPLRALAIPGLLDRPGPLLADAGDLPEAAGLLAQDAKGVRSEGVHDLVGVDLADAGHQAAAEVLADPVDARGQFAAELGDLELGTVLGVARPLAGEVERLAAFHPGKGPDDRHQFAAGLALGGLGPQLRDRVVVLLVKENDALDHPGEGGGGGGRGGRLNHGLHPDEGTIQMGSISIHE